jgi:hypothetical protein
MRLGAVGEAFRYRELLAVLRPYDLHEANWRAWPSRARDYTEVDLVQVYGTLDGKPLVLTNQEPFEGNRGGIYVVGSVTVIFIVKVPPVGRVRYPDR